MELPITEKDLDTIISALRIGGDTSLYQKLLNYKLDYFNVQKGRINDGLS